MPNIRTFDSGSLALRPTETGIEAHAAAGRRQGAFFNQVAGATQELGHEETQMGRQQAEVINRLGKQAGSAVETGIEQYEKYETHKEIARGAPAFANFLDQRGRDWDKAVNTADPNDPTLAGKFRESLETDLNNLKTDGFTTEKSRAWAEAHVDRMREHFFHKTSSDMSRLAGEAAKVGHQQTINSLSSRAYSDPSPETLRTVFDLYKSSTDALVGSSPNLTGVAGAALRGDLMQKGLEGIVRAAAMGHIEKYGQVPDWINSKEYAPYVNGAELKIFEKQADAMRRAKERDVKETTLQQKRLDQQNALDRATELTNQYINPETGEYSFPKNFNAQVLTDPVLRKYPAAMRELLREYKEVTRGQADEKLKTISERTTRELLGKIRRNEIANDEPISERFEKGDLTRSDYSWLVNHLSNIRTPEGLSLEKDRAGFLKTFAPIIDGDYKTQYQQHSQLGAQQMYLFEKDARRQEAALRSKGLDPHLTYDPRSEHFWGREENIAKYHVSLQEAQKHEATLKAMDKANAEAGKDGLPLPKEKTELKNGVLYKTNRGPAKWNAEKGVFVSP